MVDNVVLNPGLNGAQIATDDILGVQYQRNKITLGADGINNGDLSASNPMPAYFPPVAPVNRSGTITTGGTAQILMSANPIRRGFDIQNNSAGDLAINVTNGTASLTANSIIIPTGSLYESPLSGCTNYAISIIGATTGQVFFASEW
jgi:hypothetical protein